MEKSRLTVQSRQSLDARFKDLPPAISFVAPPRGWIKAIRGALGMSAAQLAKRLNVSQPTIVAIEQSESKGTIQLNTLSRIAAAMNCTLAYTLLPNEPLEDIVAAQAHKLARRRLRSVEHSMLLEDQYVPEKDFEKRVDALAEDIKPRALWEEP